MSCSPNLLASNLLQVVRRICNQILLPSSSWSSSHKSRWKHSKSPHRDIHKDTHRNSQRLTETHRDSQRLVKTLTETHLGNFEDRQLVRTQSKQKTFTRRIACDGLTRSAHLEKFGKVRRRNLFGNRSRYHAEFSWCSWWRMFTAVNIRIEVSTWNSVTHALELARKQTRRKLPTAIVAGGSAIFRCLWGSDASGCSGSRVAAGRATIEWRSSVNRNHRDDLEKANVAERPKMQQANFYKQMEIQKTNTHQANARSAF